MDEELGPCVRVEYRDRRGLRVARVLVTDPLGGQVELRGVREVRRVIRDGVAPTCELVVLGRLVETFAAGES